MSIFYVHTYRMVYTTTDHSQLSHFFQASERNLGGPIPKLLARKHDWLVVDKTPLNFMQADLPEPPMINLHITNQVHGGDH